MFLLNVFLKEVEGGRYAGYSGRLAEKQNEKSNFHVFRRFPHPKILYFDAQNIYLIFLFLTLKKTEPHQRKV